MKYQIIEGSYTLELERKVNQAIKQGWVPIGGVCHDTSHDSGATVCQAMLFGGEE